MGLKAERRGRCEEEGNATRCLGARRVHVMCQNGLA
jgi:hypothetical protein